MSDNTPLGQSFDSGFNFGIQGPAAEMQAMLDRAKDERLRLVRLLKDCEARFGTTGVVPPAEEIARLTGKVRAIDEAVRERYKQLRHDETMVQKRAYQIDQLRECVQGLTDQLDQQIDKAKRVKPDLAAVRELVQGEADRVLDQSRAQVSQIGQAMAARLEEYRNAQLAGEDQLRASRREIEQVFRDIDERLAAAAGLARDEAQKLIDPIFTQLETHATDCGQRIRELVEMTDDLVMQKLESLPAEAQKALAPTRDSLDGVIEDAKQQIARVNETLDSLDGRMLQFSEQTDQLLHDRLESLPGKAFEVLAPARTALDKLVADAREQVSSVNDTLAIFDARVKELTGHCEGIVERHQGKLEEQACQTLDKLTAERVQQIDERLEQREREMLRELERVVLDRQAEVMLSVDEMLSNHSKQMLEKHTGLIDETMRQRMDAAAEAINKKIDTMLADAEQRAETMGQQVKDRLAASIEQTRVEAEDDAVRLEDLIEADAGRALANMEQQRTKVAKAIEQIESQAIDLGEKVDQRATDVGQMIETTLREHVVSAMSQAETFTEPYKARLEATLEEHRRRADEIVGSARTQLVEQAESHFGDIRSQARDLLDRYQSEINEQSDAAIDQVQTNMRDRIQELATSSQQMVSMIEKQLSRRLKVIEPQAQQTADAVEQQIGERLSRLRENAEAMVQLVEDQLGKRIAELQPSAINAARSAEDTLNEQLNRIRQEVEGAVAPLRKQVMEELANMAELSKNLRGLGRADHPAGLKAGGGSEAPVVDISRLTTPLQEMASRIGMKPVKLAGSPEMADAGQPRGGDNEPDDDRQAA